METILDRIIAVKKREVEHLKGQVLPKQENSFKRRSFTRILENTQEMAIIAEFKRASPSKGDINLNVDPAVQTRKYTEAGADAVSVLTDSTFFKGSMADLEEARSTIDVPILCKDFIIDPIQIDVAKGAGADIVLLIAAALDGDELASLYHYALSKGLEVLMEVHNEREVEKVLKTANNLIGVNNRNLKNFEVSLEVTEKLAPIITKEGRFLISESGLKTIDDIKRVAKAGANGVLVGESFMMHCNPSEAIRGMKLPIAGVFES